MKYKGISLIEDTEAEILINLEVVGEFEEEDLEEKMEEIDEILEDVLHYDNVNIFSEQVDDNLIQIRSEDLTLDEAGIKLLSILFEDLKNIEIPDVKVLIGVHVDADEWFTGDDGNEYNEDVAETWEEFENNLEM